MDLRGGSREQGIFGGDEEEEEDEGEENLPLLERFARKPLTQATMDICEEAQMMAVMLISSEAVVPVADGESAAAAADCEAGERRRLFRVPS